MKIIAAAALIASSFTPAALPIFVSAAGATTVDGSFCNLTTKQLAKGWSCDQRSRTDNYYSVGAQNGGIGCEINTNICHYSYTCQDYAESTTIYVGVNPARRDDPLHTVTGDTTNVAVGGSYDRWDGCNYPIA